MADANPGNRLEDIVRENFYSFSSQNSSDEAKTVAQNACDKGQVIFNLPDNTQFVPTTQGVNPMYTNGDPTYNVGVRIGNVTTTFLRTIIPLSHHQDTEIIEKYVSQVERRLAGETISTEEALVPILTVEKGEIRFQGFTLTKSIDEPDASKIQPASVKIEPGAPRIENSKGI